MKNILIVDDDPLVRQVLCAVLASEQLRVIAVADGREALEIMRDRPEAIDLLLIDFMLPGMNGRALARAVRSRVPDVKIMFMSGLSEDVVRPETAIEQQARFFSKPLDLEELLKAVREEIGLFAATASPSVSR